ncbi:MAG: hypothetical protein LBC94_01975 [Desulfovibrio sp.]|nr:hypothetical protein [Desulfovibrio sp.]
MENYAYFTAASGRISLDVRILHLGTDVQCLLCGGDAHIGAVALAWMEAGVPQSHLLCLPEHREGEIALRMARTLAQALHCAVCISAGIHFDDIAREEIAAVENLANELTGQCLDFFGQIRRFHGKQRKIFPMPAV